LGLDGGSREKRWRGEAEGLVVLVERRSLGAGEVGAGEFQEVEADGALGFGESAGVGVAVADVGMEVLDGLEAGAEELERELIAGEGDQGLIGGAEGGLAQPAAEDGGAGPVVGTWARGAVAESADESGLSVRHAG